MKYLPRRVSPLVQPVNIEIARFLGNTQLPVRLRPMQREERFRSCSERPTIS